MSLIRHLFIGIQRCINNRSNKINHYYRIYLIVNIKILVNAFEFISILLNSNSGEKQKENKEIIKAGVVNDDLNEAIRLASDKDIIHRKIQLWANKEENEYAIRLLLDGDLVYEMGEKGGRRREFIASTNPKERYTHPIAETDKLDLLRNGWDYTLKDLVENYKRERIEMAKSSASIMSKNDNLKHHDFDDNDNDYPIKFVTPHKCSYCLAGFKNEEERKNHELKWHI